ncbi:MAG: hypothetical protein A2Y62_01715 [Candidatus Fischerbacteria bacterium RBG_13_37_8]|uniref:Response regulatory domain-containing protein n=1 Tax=Candidatus Fischerbacteria bacterium RBG_13_37_8 TaxID=1817863 RepID=A0A1F5VDL1_9BACT|nr:MAG: hypothetical protein A2Y62_01715 [Candidatus Fischerbacteria bacterium RBG_13_37_8]
MKKKLLIADDNEYLVEILKTDLEMLNYEVDTAKDGEDALKKIANNKPDLLILDVMMPKLNGYQVCRKIKSDTDLKDIAVIMLTAKTAPDDKYWGIDCGADEYMTKPFETEELEDLIKKKLDERTRGKRSHSVTGLPVITVFNDEREKRSQTGVPCAILRFHYKEDCLDDIETMYGKFCTADVLKLTAKHLSDFSDGLKAHNPFLGYSGDNCFFILINASKEQTVEIGKKCAQYLNKMLGSIDLSKNEPKSKPVDKKQPVVMLGCSVQLINQE